jgi:hypothetical protein
LLLVDMAARRHALDRRLADAAGDEDLVQHGLAGRGIRRRLLPFLGGRGGLSRFVRLLRYRLGGNERRDRHARHQRARLAAPTALTGNRLPAPVPVHFC